MTVPTLPCFVVAALILQAPAPHAPAPTAPPARAPTEDSPAAPQPLVEPYAGTLSEGLKEVRRLAEARAHDQARELATRLLAPTPLLRWKETTLAAGGWKGSAVRAMEPVLDVLGLEAHSPRARAEVRFASGVVAASVEDRPGAASDFESTRALAGPGELRLGAGYQLATNALLEAEALRAAIPELQPQGAAGQAQPPAPAVPGHPGAGGLAGGLSGAPGAHGAPGAAGGALDGPDPLALARAAYLQARERCVERLRADWNDADTRANTELVMKRLRELDELEKQREEQKKKEQEENKDPEQQKDSKDKQEQKDPSKGEQDEKQDDPKDPKPEEKQDEQKPEEQPKSEDESKDGKKQEDPPTPSEERELSKEELTRLLDVLKQREQQWKKLQQQIHQARRAKVKKDW